MKLKHYNEGSGYLSMYEYRITLDFGTIKDI
jgi:hypothetical protein